MNVWTRLTGASLLALVVLTTTAASAGDEVEELHVTVHLLTGAKIEGIVRGGLEVLVNGSFRPVSDATSPAAGYRIWYTTGTNGFIFVHHRDIVRIENRGAVTNEQRKQLENALARLREVAEQGRQRAREELRSLEERQKAEDEEEKVAAAAEAEEAEQKKAEEKAQRLKALIERFAPPEWTPDRREKIERNRVVLGLPPSAEEQEWLDSYDEWKQAYDLWEKEQAEGTAEESGDS
jgi:hypothetical protein